MPPTETTTTTHNKTSQTILQDRIRKWRQQGLWWVVLVAPYTVGVVWHLAHPWASVLTADWTHPRQLYTDENSAETHYFRVNHAKYQKRYQQLQSLRSRKKNNQTVVSSLCQALPAVTALDPFAMDYDRSSHVTCRTMPLSYPHNNNQWMDILQITPIEGPITVRSEAVVWVVPASRDWFASPLHMALWTVVMELWQPAFQWLSKTVYIVAPHVSFNVTHTTHAFLDAYLGPPPSARDHHATTPVRLPPGIPATALLRQLLVWDQLVVHEKGQEKLPLIRLLPQGRRGMLPNMDLVAVVRSALQRTVGANVHYAIHPQQGQATALLLIMGYYWNTLCTMVPGLTAATLSTETLTAVSDFWGFQQALRSSPDEAPHAVALERGMDAVTVQFVYAADTTRTRHVATKLPAAMELCLRALSNLHERLHHSTSLYLLLNMDQFVKHEEYLVPNLLLLVPLILRAVTLFLVDLDCSLHWAAMGVVTERIVVSMFVLTAALDGIDSLHGSTATRHAAVGLVYLYFAWRLVGGQPPQHSVSSSTSRPSVQFGACLWCLYTHLAIAFGHVSLAFPSALLWTPLLAFPLYSAPSVPESTTVRRVGNGLVALGLMPLVWLIPSGLISSYTAYVCYAYIPLHLLVCHLLLSG